MLRPFRAFRSRIIRPSTGQIADLRAENRELRRRVDEITSLLDDGLTTLSRTGQAVRSIERELAADRADPPIAKAITAVPTPGGATDRRVSVVIATLDRAESLGECLLAVRGLDYWPFEVVVVNGPSTDTTAALLDGWRDRVKVAQCPVFNIAAARNIGVAAASGDVVAFLDDDTYPEPSWLGELLEGLDAVAAGVGGQVRNRAGTAVEILHLVDTRLGETTRFRDLDPTPWYATPYSDRFVVLPGGNSAYRRDALIEIGGFDEAFEYGGEEADLDLRLRDAGFELSVAPSAVVYHQALSNADRTSDGVVRDRYRFLRSKSYFTLKHAVGTHSASEMAASHDRSVERFRAERRAAIASGLLEPRDLERLDDEAARAVVDAAEQWRRGPQMRSPEWFAAASGSFLPFAADRSDGPRLHECIVLGPGVALAEGLAQEAERAAQDRAIVRIVRVVAGPGRVTIEAGVWRHDVSDPGNGDATAAGQTVVAAVRRIHAARRVDRIRTRGLPSSWIVALESIGVPVETG